MTEELSRVFNRKVVLAEVHTVSAHGAGNVRMIVDDQYPASLAYDRDQSERDIVYPPSCGALVPVLEQPYAGRERLEGRLFYINAQDVLIEYQAEPPDAIAADYNTSP